ncbi:MAG: fumarylacetoacetate hydrolase family protein, partial [Chitinophagaceae bacterium]
MKLVSYLKEDHEQLGVFVDGIVYDIEHLHPELPNTMSMFLAYWEDYFAIAQEGAQLIEEGRIALGKGTPLENVQLLAPVPFPTSCRDGYAFRQHVAAARRNRKVDMIAEFDQYPIFYFTNHHSIKGPGEVYCMPDHFEKL